MSRSRAIAAVVAIVILIGVGGYVVYDQVLRGDSAAALALPTAAPPATFDGSLAGTWAVAADSVAGYRVRERLANLPAESDAVGRTGQVTGSITITTDGTTTSLTEASLNVDTTSISSDKSMRDNRLRSEGLQTDQFQTATFTLTAPVDIPAGAIDGTASDVTLSGDLTLHGVTKSVEIPTQAQLIDGVISVAGSITFPLSDYSIVAPNIGGFIVSIADDGTLEFLVNFTPA